MAIDIAEIKPNDTWGVVIDRLNQIIGISSNNMVTINDGINEGDFNLSGNITSNNIIISNGITSNIISSNTITSNNISSNNLTFDIAKGNTANIVSVNVNTITSNNNITNNLVSNNISVNNMTITNQILSANVNHLEVSVGIFDDVDINDLTVDNLIVDQLNSNSIYASYTSSEKIDSELISTDNLVVNGSTILQSLSNLIFQPNQIILSNNTSNITTMNVTSYGLSLLQTNNSVLLGDYVKKDQIGPFADKNKTKISMTDLNVNGTVSNTTFLRSDGVYAIPQFPSTQGNMNTSVYDPTNVNKDAFSMDNMRSGNTNIVLTLNDKNKYDASHTFVNNMSILTRNNEQLLWNGNVISDPITKYIDKTISYSDLTISNRDVQVSNTTVVVKDIAFNIDLSDLDGYDNIEISVDSIDSNNLIQSTQVNNDWMLYYSLDNNTYIGNNSDSYMIFHSFVNTTYTTPISTIALPIQTGDINISYFKNVNTFLTGRGGNNIGFRMNFYNNTQTLNIKGSSFNYSDTRLNSGLRGGNGSIFEYVSDMSKIFTTPTKVQGLKITMSSFSTVSDSLDIKLRLKGSK